MVSPPSNVTTVVTTKTKPVLVSTASANITQSSPATPTTATVKTITPCPQSSATITTSAPVTSTSPVTVTGNCNGVQQWQSAFAYTAGDRVIFDNNLYTARQWTYNNAPPAHPDQWAADGACTPPINNQANCNGVSAWQNNVAYTAGNEVTFNGHLWSAVQWTQANSPGDTSGTWKDEGACA